MSSAEIQYDQSFVELFGTLIQIVKTERAQTKAECNAFAAFAKRISNQQISRSQASTDTAYMIDCTTNQSDIITHLNSIQSAYEETVMDLPFYHDEYNDSYTESIRAEFGTEIATALSSAACFGANVEKALLDRIATIRSERKKHIETCNREYNSIKTASNVLIPVDEQLSAHEATLISAEPVDESEMEYSRLSAIYDRCEAVAEKRQKTIHQQYKSYTSRTDADIYMYLYDSLDVTYPILTMCIDTIARIDRFYQYSEPVISIDK